MSKYQGQLIKYINDNPDFILPESRKNEILGILLCIVALFIFASFVTYNPLETPSTLKDEIAKQNIMGVFGVYVSYYLMKLDYLTKSDYFAESDYLTKSYYLTKSDYLVKSDYWMKSDYLTKSDYLMKSDHFTSNPK